MTVRRFAGRSGLVAIDLADWIAVPPTRDIAEGQADPFRQQEVKMDDYLARVRAFGADALIELIQARLELIQPGFDEEDDPEGWDDVGVTTAVVTCNYRSRVLH